MVRRTLILATYFMVAWFPMLIFGWNPDAGLVPSFTDNATVTASSTTPDAFPQRVVDGDDNTFWQSAAPLPTGYVVRPDLNLLTNACAQGRYSASAVVNATNATDANFNTAAQVQAQNGSAWLEVLLPTPQSIIAATTKLYVSDPVVVYAVTASGNVPLDTIASDQNYQTIRIDNPQHLTVSHLRLESSTNFKVFEIATLSEIYETITVDLGTIRTVQWIETRHWAGPNNPATSTRLFGSTDGVTFTLLATLDPNTLSRVITYLPTPVAVRYLRIRHDLVSRDWTKVYVWEIDAYDPNGPYGSPPAAQFNPHTMGELLGINGIWGWGTGMYSDNFTATQSGGPYIYNVFASHARNYHNLNWDVTDPDITPDYQSMAAGNGTQAKWWLNWDREYGAWQDAGLAVEASIQFTEQSVPQSSWDTPYQSAYNYGYAFAQHFGPTHGTGDVTVMEVGNEPWDYDPALYREILEGMAAGAKAGDPAMKVLPAAFQAHQPDDGVSPENYMGTHITATAAVNLDGLNVHAYSHYRLPDGTRISVWPEHPLSGMKAIYNAIRFRDANMPGKPIYLTEWGWDSDGGGEFCHFSECVSEKAQALYLVRAAFIGARLGLDRLTIYFFANTKDTCCVFTRSGVTGSSLTNFQTKKSLVALQALVHRVGNCHFLQSIQENSDGYIYLFGDSSQTATHLVGWLPVEGTSLQTATASFTLPYQAGEAWYLGGESTTGEPAPPPTVSSGNWTLTLSATPIVVELLPDQSLPVSLTDFSATSVPGEVVLRWETETEIDITAFQIERGEASEDFRCLAQIPVRGNSQHPHRYTYRDRTVRPGKTYHYRLVLLHFAGERTYSEILSVQIAVSSRVSRVGRTTPQRFALYPNFPNPFNGTTVIRFDLPVTEEGLYPVRLAIFDMWGRCVAEVLEGELAPGKYQVEWDGRNDLGQSLASGVYFYHLSAGSFRQSAKMLLVQ